MQSCTAGLLIAAAESSSLQVHNLSGPIAVTDTKGEPAHPGDLLVVEILNLGPLEGDEWGFTGTFDRENGGAQFWLPA